MRTRCGHLLSGGSQSGGGGGGVQKKCPVENAYELVRGGCGYRDFDRRDNGQAHDFLRWWPHRVCGPDSGQPLLAQYPLGQVGGQGGPSCRCDGPGVTVLLKPFDLGRYATQGLTSHPPKGAPYPGPRHDVFRTGLHGLVICRDGVPSLTHNGGARPSQAVVGGARSEAEVKRDALKPCRAHAPGRHAN